MKLGIVTSTKLIKPINPEMDYFEISIDGIPYMMFGDYTETSKYITMGVYFETVNDIYEGQHIEKVIDLAEHRVVTTVKADDISKLLPSVDAVFPICNFDVGMLSLGQKQSAVVCYVTGYKENCSDKARWYDVSVVDMKSRVYPLRYFTSFGHETEQTRAFLESVIGKYIKADIMLTEWGYQVQRGCEINYYPAEVSMPEEVEIAVNVIEQVIAEDKELMSYVSYFKVIENLKEIIDVLPGYHLVTIAMELMMINSVANLTDTFMKRTLIRTAITSRGYLINRKNDLSKPVLNINKVLRSDLKEDKMLMSVLDAVSTNTSATKRMYIWISNFIRYILEERRGLINEEDIISSVDSISRDFGGLL